MVSHCPLTGFHSFSCISCNILRIFFVANHIYDTNDTITINPHLILSIGFENWDFSEETTYKEINFTIG